MGVHTSVIFVATLFAVEKKTQVESKKRDSVKSTKKMSTRRVLRYHKKKSKPSSLRTKVKAKCTLRGEAK